MKSTAKPNPDWGDQLCSRRYRLSPFETPLQCQLNMRCGMMTSLFQNYSLFFRDEIVLSTASILRDNIIASTKIFGNGFSLSLKYAGMEVVIGAKFYNSEYTEFIFKTLQVYAIDDAKKNRHLYHCAFSEPCTTSLFFLLPFLQLFFHRYTFRSSVIASSIPPNSLFHHIKK